MTRGSRIRFLAPRVAALAMVLGGVTARAATCPGASPSNGDELATIARCAKTCAFLTGEQQTNCLKFVSDPEIPQDALAWTLAVFRDNRHGLRMNQCLLPPPDHYSNIETVSVGMPSPIIEQPAMTIPDLRGGIKNHCQLMINDTRARWSKDFPYRRTYYYLDLCKGTKKTGYFHVGTGGKTGLEANKTDRKSTVLGAFLTSDTLFSYDNGGPKYDPIKKEYGYVAALALFGLQETNNGSARDFKYMHVSPHKSSWGCPSLAPEDEPLIRELAAGGPSLVVNYGPEEQMQDPRLCTGTSPGTLRGGRNR